MTGQPGRQQRQPSWAPCTASRSSASTGASTPTCNHSRKPVTGFGRQTEDRRLIAVEVGEPHPAARARQRQHAHAAANTERPEPPFGDQQHTSTTPPHVEIHTGSASSR